MPKGIIEAMKEGYSKSGLDTKSLNKRVYGGLNNLGFMKGSKETALGAKKESQFQSDRSGGKKKGGFKKKLLGLGS